MTNSNMTCAEFDAALPDYLEGTLDEPLRAIVQKHLSECVRCISLVRDLERIQNDAAAMPDLVPSRDLWQGIEARIAAPVIPLAARPERQKRFAPAWMGVAAAALIVSTAGITYMLTARSFQGRTGSVALGNTATRTSPQTGIDTAATLSPPAGAAETSGANNQGREAISRVARTESSPSSGKRLTATLASRPVGRESSEVVYGREIENLQKIVTSRRTQLDSATVAIIERNLQIIDAAIAQSRAALARDPASRLLSDQLTHALDKKVELLRTAALLPVNT
jgi:anti-sigma factor RsiW